MTQWTVIADSRRFSRCRDRLSPGQANSHNEEPQLKFPRRLECGVRGSHMHDSSVVVETSVTVVVCSQVEFLTRNILADAAFVQIRGRVLPFEEMKQ